jgi:hypothetical protein
MALDPRKRQKKLERKKAKERKSLAVARARSSIDRFAQSAAAPIHDCFHSADLWEQGIGWVVISRQLSNGQLAFAAFLLDVFCLGVKNVHCDVVGPAAYESKVVSHLSKVSPLVELMPADAKKLVEDAVSYANDLGILPHADYRRAHAIFGDIDAADSIAQYTFGKEGKPFFVSGPNDGPDKCHRIVGILSARCGPGNFDYIVHFSEADFFERVAPLLNLEDVEVIDEEPESDP